MKLTRLYTILGLSLSVLLLMGIGMMLVGTETAVAGGPWYVNASTGRDGNSCLSAGSACATVTGALGKADAGDTIHIAAGTYDEEIYIEQAVNLIGAGADQTILTNSSGYAVNIYDDDYTATQFPVTIQEIAIQGASGIGLFTQEAVTLQNAVIQNNDGLGIQNYGTITITNSSITGNTAPSGAAIMNAGSARMTMTDATVSGNEGSNTIVHVQNDAHATLTNVTISDNIGNGSGLSIAGSAVVTVTNSTITNNRAGISHYGDQLFIQNSVVAGNEYNCWNPVTSLGNNLEDDDTCGFDEASDQVNTDPQLGTLGSNGGDVHTVVPLSGSPLIDAGRNDVCPATDARGLTRPFDGDDNGSVLCDIGAVEYTTIGVSSVAIDAPASGNVNTNITINAAVLPDTATSPITYTWTADGQSQVVQTSGNSDSVTFNWTSTGAKTINVTADNGLAQSSDSVQIEIIDGVEPLASVIISGTNSGVINKDFTLTANVLPTYATQPVTYTWETVGQSSIIHNGSLSDQVAMSWASEGTYTVTVTADNGVNSVQDQHVIDIVSWYVNGSSGHDGNDCESADAACATIQAALNKAATDGTVYIAAGTYDGYLYIEDGAKLVGSGTDQTILTNGGGTAVTVTDHSLLTTFEAEMHYLTVANADEVGISNSETLRLSNVTVHSNDTRGISNSGTLVMEDGLIHSHTGTSGIAILNSGDATLTAVTVTSNAAENTIVHTQTGGTMRLTNVTISGNFSGTAVLSTGGSVVEILNSTIVNNAVAIGNYATVTLQNSILDNNGSDNCTVNNVTSLGNNIENGDGCNLNQPGDLVNTDPLLDLLADNGGVTPTHYPQKESPAIDAGNDSACPATDQRGEIRPYDGDVNGTAVCDIGAVEYTGNYTAFLPIIIR